MNAQNILFAGLLMLWSFSAFSASCMPVNQYGSQCISVVKNIQEPRSYGTEYIIEFKNICDKSISVSVDKKEKFGAVATSSSSAGVPAGGNSKITCIDKTDGSLRCGGFGSWHANCF